jgi:gliding motility-associated-like protein
VATPPLSKTYRVKITADVFGCASVLYDTVVITMYPLVVANAGRDTVVAINQPLQLQATGGVKYLWSPTYGLNNPNIATPVAILDRDITYTVKVSDVIGCSRNASINVKVFKGPEIYVPNAFTPNGDGINDIMQPIAIGFKSFDYFVIYNRWGEKVYETNNPKLGWNGVYKGVAQSTAGFVWMARGTAYTGAVVERKGTFVLIR